LQPQGNPLLVHSPMLSSPVSPQVKPFYLGSGSNAKNAPNTSASRNPKIV
jgi:hypothetical protein